MIKFYDLNKQDKIINNEILKSVKKVIKNKNFINGSDVSEFENNFSKYIGSKYSIGCSNGTDALTIALNSLNLPKGSEVILPAMTYISTLFSVFNANLKPVLVDINIQTGLTEVDEILKKITHKTKVIMPVHLYGNVFDIFELRKKIKKNIFIIEDSSQAHGARYKNYKRVGSLCDLSCFSLYPGKNLGAYGDAGIITTNNLKLFNRIKKITNLGVDRKKKYDHDLLGFNNRLDTIQAAILNVKINNLDKNNSMRNKIARFYDKNIINKKITKIKYSKYSVYHQYILLVNRREKFQNYLIKNHIQSGIHYPKSINQHACTKKYFKNQKYINAENFAKKCVSIPIDPYLKSSELKKIIKVINSY